MRDAGVGCQVHKLGKWENSSEHEFLTLGNYAINSLQLALKELICDPTRELTSDTSHIQGVEGHVDLSGAH